MSVQMLVQPPAGRKRHCKEAHEHPGALQHGDVVLREGQVQLAHQLAVQLVAQVRASAALRKSDECECVRVREIFVHCY